MDKITFAKEKNSNSKPSDALPTCPRFICYTPQVVYQPLKSSAEALIFAVIFKAEEAMYIPKPIIKALIP
ncbi:MAG TPA: hypothetical protein PKC76_06505 [Saprospiraceae bacterium]|nr:hypothetical protein [Saprospiraceae bacterium]HMP23762.1 hypothetical protein [Saprospiraceae bacterium]